MLEGFGMMLVPHKQHKLQAQGKEAVVDSTAATYGARAAHNTDNHVEKAMSEQRVVPAASPVILLPLLLLLLLMGAALHVRQRLVAGSGTGSTILTHSLVCAVGGIQLPAAPWGLVVDLSLMAAAAAALLSYCWNWLTTTGASKRNLQKRSVDKRLAAALTAH
jgi:hypothetical protein